jgi:hypothetical protein
MRAYPVGGAASGSEVRILPAAAVGEAARPARAGRAARQW